MYISSAADFPLFCSNSARKCHILPADGSPQKSPILLKILPAKFIQAYHGSENAENKLSNVKGFIILRPGEGLTSFDKDNSVKFLVKTYNNAFRGIYFLRIREKPFSQISYW